MSKDEKVWQHYGETNSYFAVATFDKFRDDNLSETAKNEFFRTGEEYISRIWNEIETNFTAEFRPRRSLDFGCGVGRLVAPIARRSGEAVGVDISEGMLKQAQQNCAEMNIANVEFYTSDETLSKVSGSFDFVHSFIVFQHIAPRIGEKIFRRMVEMLAEDGIGAVQFQYANTNSTAGQKLRDKLYRRVPLVYSLRNLILRTDNEPLLPLYLYNINNLLTILQKNDCHNSLLRFTEHGIDGVLLIFQKKKQTLY